MKVRLDEMPKNGANMEFFYCEIFGGIQEIARLILSLSEHTTYLFFNKQNFNSQKSSINWIWRENLTTAAFNSAVMIKSDNKIYQDMVRGMMGLQVPSGGSVAKLGSNSDTFGPEGQDDQGKVSWIIMYNDVSREYPRKSLTFDSRESLLAEHLPPWK